MPIRKHTNGETYWTIDNVKDKDGHLVKYKSEKKALEVLAAIEANKHKNMSEHTLENVELLKIGSYTDSKGKHFEVNDSVLSDLVDTFAEPVAGNIDHENKGPACGWVHGLKVEGGKLLAKIADISSSFWKRLEEKEFANRSVEVSKHGGKWRLDGFAWLGAKRPAVKGMAQLQFSDDDGNYLNITLNKEDDNMPDPNVAELQQTLGATKAKLSEAEEAKNNLETQLASATTDKADLEAKLAEATKKADEAQLQLSEAQRAANKVTTEAYLEALVKKGQITPAMRKAGLDELMLAMSTEEKITLSEGDKTVEKSHADILKAVLEAAPADPSRFSESTGFGTGDETEPAKDNSDLAKAIDAYKTKHNCSEDEAVDAVTRIASEQGRSMT